MLYLFPKMFFYDLILALSVSEITADEFVCLSYLGILMVFGQLQKPLNVFFFNKLRPEKLVRCTSSTRLDAFIFVREKFCYPAQNPRISDNPQQFNCRTPFLNGSLRAIDLVAVAAYSFFRGITPTRL